MHFRSALASAFILCPAALLAQAQGPPPAPVTVIEAVEKQMASHLWVPGTVVSRSDARIAAEVSGQLTWVAEVGEVIARGAVLARTDDSSLQLQLKNDDATIKRLQANLKFVDQQLERLQRLSDQQIVSRNDLEEMTSRKESAEQELVAAEVSRERTLFQLSRTRVKAPFGGKVVERLHQPGGYVSVGSDIVRLVDISDIEVRAQAPLSVEPFLEEGLNVAIRGKNREVSGAVRTVIRVGDERSRMFELRVAADAGSWVIGSPVRVALPASDSRQVIAVPRDALVLRSDSIYVFRITDEGTAERIAVETGVGDSALVEILGDVGAGDKIVIRGGERLRPGQTVAVSDS